MKTTQEGPWHETQRGIIAYRAARAMAQASANADGFDRGIERNDIFKSFSVFMLPRREHRRGHELRCEVVCCEIIEKTQAGHGYK